LFPPSRHQAIALNLQTIIADVLRTQLKRMEYQIHAKTNVIHKAFEQASERGKGARLNQLSDDFKFEAGY
jgi:hypothetical protein